MSRRVVLAAPLIALFGCGSAAAVREAEPGAAAPAPAAPESPKRAAERPAPEASATATPPPAAIERATVVDKPLSGALTQADIARILEKQGALFDVCYSLGAGKSRDFRATVTVKATVGPNGVVNATEVLKSTAKNPKVDTCVAQAFRKVKFPPPQNGGTMVITFPITFAGSQMVEK